MQPVPLTVATTRLYIALFAMLKYQEIHKLSIPKVRTALLTVLAPDAMACCLRRDFTLSLTMIMQAIRSLAKAAAIAQGQVLSNEEMNHLVDGLLTSASPNYTPDGKTALVVIKEDELEKMFKRSI